jgi:hypothetical protein
LKIKDPGAPFRGFSKQTICFVGRDRYKAFGLMSDMAMLRQHPLEPLPTRRIEQL